MPVPGTIIPERATSIGEETLNLFTETREIDTTFGEATAARMANAWRSTIIYNLFDREQLKVAMRGEPISGSFGSQKDAWKGSPYFREGLEFRAGMSWEYARLLALHHDAQRRRDSRIERGPDGFRGFVSGALGITAAFADPVNFIPVTHIGKVMPTFAALSRTYGARAIAAFSRGAMVKNVSRAVTGKLGGLLTKKSGVKGAAGLLSDPIFREAVIDSVAIEAFAQPVLKDAAELRGEKFEIQHVAFNMAIAFGAGAAFGALGAGINRWGAKRKLRGLQKAADDFEAGRPIDVEATVRNDPEDAITVRDTVKENTISLRERLIDMDDARVSRIANADPSTPSGKRIRDIFQELDTLKGAIRTTGRDHSITKAFTDSIDNALSKSPEGTKAIEDLIGLEDVTGDVLDNIQGFGKYSRPAREALQQLPMKQIEIDNPIVAERIKARADAMREELLEASGPEKTRTPEGKFITSKSTRPVWMQGLREKGMFVSEAKEIELGLKRKGKLPTKRETESKGYNSLLRAIEHIIAGTDDKARGAVVRRLIPEVKAKAISDLMDGFDGNDAPIWALRQGSTDADEFMKRQMRVLDGEDLHGDDLAYTVADDTLEDGTNAVKARENVARDAATETPLDDLSPEQLTRDVEDLEARLRAAAPEEFEKAKFKSKELLDADAELRQMSKIDQAYDFVSKCILNQTGS